MDVHTRSIFVTTLLVGFIYETLSLPTTKYKYVGCYEDRDDISMFSQKVYVQGLLSFLNPNECVNKCAEADFPYAGITSGQECRCSRDYASDIAKTSDLECDSVWLSKIASEVYPTRLAVYETGVFVGAIVPAKIYLGCYRDDNAEFRLLKSSNHQFQRDNSPATCHNHCVKAGHRYFGLTNSFECWCGDTKPSNDVLVEESECDAKCTGHSEAKCGGGWRLSVYATGITDIPSDNRYVGCFKHSEEDKVFIAEYTIVLKTANSPRRCLNLCLQFGYKFAAVQNREGCYCGSQLPPSSTKEPDKSCNSIKCVGDPTETCGSRYHMKVYQTPKDEKKQIGATPEYLGCYKDQPENQLMEESVLSLPKSLTPQLCIQICQQRGYPFAGLRFGKYCHCDYYYPSGLSTAAEIECLTPCPGSPSEYCGGASRLQAYYTGSSRAGILPASIYKGCFRDDDKNNRMLKGTWQELDNDSPKVCQRLCYKTGYRYFGLTWIRECFCGDEDPSSELLIDEVECNKPCGGDSNKICGGGWRTSIYSTGLTDIPIGDRYIGCYTLPSTVGLPASSGILSEYVVTLSRSNSPRRCLNICDQLDYRFAGVERGIDCRCGNKQPPDNLKDNTPNACDLKCPGDETETCGKSNKIRIFKTTRAGVAEEEATSGEEIAIKTDDLKKCGDTYTTRNRERTCKGHRIFNQDFITINSSVWKHEVLMPTLPDYEFVTFTNSPDVCYIHDGKLVIKPKVQQASYISGKVNLEGCTGTPGSEECIREARTYNILPPVLSARLTTKDSFQFRYGTIQVRARLPTGDWLVPEIRLVPKDMAYGENYMSGQIRIVMSRGNRHFKCGGRDLSHNFLEFGVYVGLPGNVKKKVVTRLETNNTFHHRFHNYRLLWTPDNLQFFIDGEALPPLLSSSTDTIRSVTDQPSNAGSVWDSGSKLAPFDREFFISVGVGVGGIRDFEDNCTTSRGLKKPWINNNPKAMLNFWQSREAWESTWNDNRPQLEIEHIRVHAL